MTLHTEVFVILVHFLVFHSPDNAENKKFELMQIRGDIIILHICTVNDNIMFES